jgi:hypothetical protein
MTEDIAQGLIDDIAHLDEQIESLSKKRSGRLQAFADETCPFKVGDTVTSYGYSHTGKRCVVSRIMYEGNSRNGYQWKANGWLLKKNGEKSKNLAEWDASQQANEGDYCVATHAWHVWKARVSDVTGD